MRPHMLAVAVAVTATLALAACAPTYDAATKDTLRQHVVAVAEASAAGDWQTALDGLDVMAAQLADARAEGKLSEERFDSVIVAMEVVRQDLAAAIAAADAAEQERLLEEQTRLQEEITQLQDQQNQGDDDESGDKNDKSDKNDDDSGGEKGKNEDPGKGKEGKDE